MRCDLHSLQLARLRWKHRMNSDILPAQNYVELLRQTYPKLDFPAYKLRQWYSKTHQVFFDCKEPDKEACLHEVLEHELCRFHSFRRCQGAERRIQAHGRQFQKPRHRKSGALYHKVSLAAGINDKVGHASCRIRIR